MPRIFISYGHDSEEHRDRVLRLAHRLCGDGPDCHLDQYETSPPRGWAQWMPTEAEWEYACRAGTTMKWSFGDEANQLAFFASFDREWKEGPIAIGQKQPIAKLVL